jgi:chitin synthase
MALRFQSNYDFTDVPIPTTSRPNPPQSTGTTIRRAKTLTKPERGVAPVPLINPPSHPSQGATNVKPSPDDYNGSTSWRLFSRIVTFWAPNFLLSSLGGLKDQAVQQAWREKITLCVIIAIMCALVGFVTVGFQKVLCPQTDGSENIFLRVGTTPGTLSVLGEIYNATSIKSPQGVDFNSLLAVSGSDITPLLQRDSSTFTACQNLNFRIAQDPPCSTLTPCPLGPLNASSTYQNLNIVHTPLLAGYSWTQVAEMTNYIVLDGAVLNLSPYMKIHPSPIPGDNVDKAIRIILDPSATGSGKDASRLFLNRQDLASAIPCLRQRYRAGNIDKITPGCFASSLLLYAGLIVILGLVVVRFAMACIFNWFLSERLAGPPNSQAFNRSAISPVVMPEGANISVDNKMGTAPWAVAATQPKKLNKQGQNAKSPRAIPSASSRTLVNSYAPSTPVMSLAQIGAELFAVCLVTCYSEGEDSLRTTLDSISATDYSDARKLLFVVADGMITGAGEKRSTPDICVGLLNADPRFGNPIPMSYMAVGSGAKAQNRAMVYAGHYSKYNFIFLQSLT